MPQSSRVIVMPWACVCQRAASADEVLAAWAKRGAAASRAAITITGFFIEVASRVVGPEVLASCIQATGSASRGHSFQRHGHPVRSEYERSEFPYEPIYYTQT